MGKLEQLEPKKVFHFFEEMNQVPRGTFNTGRISDFLVKFAKERNLDYVQDKVGNVIIRKPGSVGYEDSQPVIIQGHMDMVCEKIESSNHDFTKDPIEMFVEDGFLKAKGTTLGADDGIAVAFGLALLDDETIEHPPIELLITIDEETGMVGANNIDLSVLKGKKYINIDTDVEGTIICGCAGGFRGTIVFDVTRVEKEGTMVELQVKGLQGGHSGLDIHMQRGNGHKMMSRLLVALSKKVKFSLVSVGGGAQDNVICPWTSANIVVANEDALTVRAFAEEMKAIWDVEFDKDEPTLQVLVDIKERGIHKVMAEDSQQQVLAFISCCPNGVQCYSRQLAGLVETSINIGMVKTTDNQVECWFMGRSSIESKKRELINQLVTLGEALGAKVDVSNDYPGWMYNTNSELRPIVEAAYKRLNDGKEALVSTVHAGLECGLMLSQKPDLDCVSFGPNMHDCHTPKERLDIASAQRTWELLLEVLKACK